MANGLVLDLDSAAAAEASAVALQAALHDAEVEAAEFDARTDKHLLRISRRHHGNIKASVITQDFVHGADYAALKEAGLSPSRACWAPTPSCAAARASGPRSRRWATSAPPWPG
jgi:hypothetical protein